METTQYSPIGTQEHEDTKLGYIKCKVTYGGDDAFLATQKGRGKLFAQILHRYGSVWRNILDRRDLWASPGSPRVFGWVMRVV